MGETTSEPCVLATVATDGGIKMPTTAPYRYNKLLAYLDMQARWIGGVNWDSLTNTFLVLSRPVKTCLCHRHILGWRKQLA
jgi:hypothetical protein